MFSRLFRPVVMIAPAASLVALFALVAPAKAQIVVTLTPSFASGAPGSTVTFQATIQNQSTTQGVFLNEFFGDFASLPGDTQDVINTVDEPSFFGYFQAQFPDRRLPANTTYTGNLVDVTIRANAPNGAADAGEIVIRGGLTESERNILADLDFTVTSAVIPEASSVGLLGLGAGAFLGGAVLRRRKAR
ncbi:MAG: PEP-CTERM sorting domain-containing protein [Armatimonadetes bacterium]|nr:PEP-CTERM sorting domain-containing protein [Armatimonadota bacterium]